MDQNIKLEINNKPKNPTPTSKEEVRENAATTSNIVPRSRGSENLEKGQQLHEIEEEREKNALRNRLLVESQAEVAQLTRQNQELRLEMHKLKERCKWQEERLQYTGNKGKRRIDTEVDIFRRQNLSLSQQLEDLKYKLEMKNKKIQQIESGEKLTSWIRNNRYPIIHSIETRKQLLQQSVNELIEKQKQQAARDAALAPVFDRKHPVVRRKPTKDEERLYSAKADLKLYSNIEEFIHSILDSYHKLVLENQKSKKEMEDDKLLRTGKINSLMRLAHVRKHGVLMGFQKTMKRSQSKKNTLNRQSLSTSSLLSSSSVSSVRNLSESSRGQKDADDMLKASWVRCKQCSMYNSIKSLCCARCQSQEMEKIHI